MTETLATTAFKANFRQTNSMPGGTVLTMKLSFEPTEDGDWKATGAAEVVRGSTNPPLELKFPMAGTLLVEATEIYPPSYALHVHSDFPDGRVGTSLDVMLVTRSDVSPSQAKHLEFTGEYTYLSGPPVTVQAEVEMVNESC